MWGTSEFWVVLEISKTASGWSLDQLQTFHWLARRKSRKDFRSADSEFGVEVEEGVEAALELGFDLFARAIDNVHGDVGFMAVGQFEGCVVDLGDLAFGEEPETVDKSQIGHK